MIKKLGIISLMTLLLFPLITSPFCFQDMYPFPLIEEKKTLVNSNTFKSLRSSSSGWIPEGIPIYIGNNFLGFPQICSDGNGGAIITWKDKRNAIDDDIYVQKIDSNGNILWSHNGVLISSASSDQWAVQICSDGEGGAIITWVSGPIFTDIYAQRIDSSGHVLWTPNGKAISTASGHQIYPQICSDGNGGAIITWKDGRGIDSDIYAQRIDLTGTLQWTSNGTVICSAINDQYSVEICDDGMGGAIIVWADERPGSESEIYAQHINASGNILWTPNGIPVCSAVGSQWNPQLCSNGEGGAIITWEDSRNDDMDIYTQCIDASGTIKWTGNGTAVSTFINTQKVPQLCSDGAGGAIITWQDFRGGGAYYSDIYSQHINASGDLLWTTNGTVICTAGSYQFSPQICQNGLGGAIITWEDYRSGSTSDIYAQEINASGNVELIMNGKEICTANHDQLHPQLCYDGAGGAIITWDDRRNGEDFHIYAQEFNYIPKERNNGEFPFEFVIIITTTIGIAIVVILTTIYIIKKRRKIK